MKAKIAYLAIGSLCLSSVMSTVYADNGGYYSSGSSSSGDSGGYYSSGSTSSSSNSNSNSNNNDNNHHRDEHRAENKSEHRNNHRKKFSISINLPGITPAVEIPPPPPEEPYGDEAPEHPHYRGPHWIGMRSGDLLPPNVVIGGYQQDGPLYVCQARFHGGVHPGKIVVGNCNISYDGEEIIMHRYQVLVSRFPLNWLRASFGAIPPNAVEGGYENGHPLFICQANYRGGMHTGKIVGQHCNFGWGGREVGLPYYNVLVR